MLSEEYRLAAKEWVTADAVASLMEETKSHWFAQRVLKLGAEYIQKMVEARKEANLLKVKMEWIRMRFSERQSSEATTRAEMRL
ncbi:MAG: hypothetical protein LW635_10600 [Microcystis sp. 53598_E5]|nr:hypothetical protein [Microcystis sp. 53598_E5]